MHHIDERKRSELTFLGYLGLLPFLAGAFVAIAMPWAIPGPNAAPVIDAVVTYGAIIAAFMAGMGAGALVAQPRGGDESMLPVMVAALVAWGALWPVLPDFAPATTTRAGLVILVLFYLLLRDRRAVAQGNFPRWYESLRVRLTAWASGALTVIALRMLSWEIGGP